MRNKSQLFALTLALVMIAGALPTSLTAQTWDGKSIVKLTENDLSPWQGDTGNWQIVGRAFMDPDNDKFLTSQPGTGILWNGPQGKTKNLITKMAFGDTRAHIEFLLARDSNSGVYFTGQYEVQIFDSWQKPSEYPGIECGGIYQRWDPKRQPKGFEGHSPRVNACFPPGRWQTFDVVFRSAKFDQNGNKIANARFLKVFHNGILIHDNLELFGPTRGGNIFPTERPSGPFLFQGDHGPVAYRNVWISPIDYPDFFVLGTDPKRLDLTTEQYVTMLKDLGYNGTYYNGYDGLPRMLQELDSQGLRLYTFYTPVNLDGDKPKYDPKLKEIIELLAHRDATLWLHILSHKYKPSDPAGDEKAVEIIREIADMAQPHGVRVALYPHFGLWLERCEDSVRLTRKVNRRNVGAIFNLCHWLKVSKGQNLLGLLQDSLPYLSFVTINGADQGPTWKELIQPLDQGAYDVYGVLEMLKDLGYNGPIGLQVYGIQEEPQDHLKRSITTWRQFNNKLLHATK